MATDRLTPFSNSDGIVDSGNGKLCSTQEMRVTIPSNMSVAEQYAFNGCSRLLGVGLLDRIQVVLVPIRSAPEYNIRSSKI